MATVEVEAMEKVERSIEVRRPLRAVYNQWTQFEEFPRIMEGVLEVRQLDDTHLHWRAAVAGVEKEWDAEITEQVPDERIAWRSTSGARNAGVVRFEPIENDRTRVFLTLEYEPEGLAESIGDALGLMSGKVARTLEAFREFMESRGGETGAWRGEVHEGQDVGRPPEPRVESAIPREPTGAIAREPAGVRLSSPHEASGEVAEPAGYRAAPAGPGEAMLGATSAAVGQPLHDSAREHTSQVNEPGTVEKPRKAEADAERATAGGGTGRHAGGVDAEGRPAGGYATGGEAADVAAPKASPSRGHVTEERPASRVPSPSPQAARPTWDETFGIMRRMIEDMDSLLSGFGWPSRIGRLRGEERASWAPQVDLEQHGDQLVVTAELPGVKSEDVRVEIAENRLVLQGERRSERETTEGGVYRSERQYGSFHRTIRLPDGADPDSARATMADGVLRVSLKAPRAPASGGRKVDVESA
jgi:HSP20 family molecular chaperone IbpA/uncharacterized membrane protein